MIADIPYNPTVSISENMEICMQDVYNGHNPVNKYEVQIEDSSTLRSIIDISKSHDSNNETCRTLDNTGTISPLCGPSFNINVTSWNIVGPSSPTSKVLGMFGNIIPLIG